MRLFCLVLVTLGRSDFQCHCRLRIVPSSRKSRHISVSTTPLRRSLLWRQGLQASSQALVTQKPVICVQAFLLCEAWITPISVPHVYIFQVTNAAYMSCGLFFCGRLGIKYGIESLDELHLSVCDAKNGLLPLDVVVLFIMVIDLLLQGVTCMLLPCRPGARADTQPFFRGGEHQGEYC